MLLFLLSQRLVKLLGHCIHSIGCACADAVYGAAYQLLHPGHQPNPRLSCLAVAACLSQHPPCLAISRESYVLITLLKAHVDAADALATVTAINFSKKVAHAHEPGLPRGKRLSCTFHLCQTPI